MAFWLGETGLSQAFSLSFRDIAVAIADWALCCCAVALTPTIDTRQVRLPGDQKVAAEWAAIAGVTAGDMLDA